MQLHTTIQLLSNDIEKLITGIRRIPVDRDLYGRGLGPLNKSLCLRFFCVFCFSQLWEKSQNSYLRILWGVFSPERKNSENNVGEKVILRKSRNSEKKSLTYDFFLKMSEFWISEKNLRIQKQKNTKFYFYLKCLFILGEYTPHFLRCSNCLPYFHKAVLTGFFAEVDF